ncbi:MAG: sugar phosphate isomerase/epimerase family protein [Deltaproteobacteria bacterium]
MNGSSSRREFLQTTVFALGGMALGEPSRKKSRTHAAPVVKKHRGIQKGLVLNMLPKELSYADRFKLARDVGFEVVQAMTTPNPGEAEEILKAAEGAKIKIDSVMNMDHWKYPLSSSDAAVVQKSMEGMVTSLHNAKLWGADAVLLVPAVVNAQTPYRDAWTRSVRQIRGLLSTAAELKVAIDIEEVWNKFLLSPLEFAKYVDEFKSPWVRAWFDVGNVVLFGYPQDWIRTLGRRIDKIHLKDFKRKENGYEWVNLGDGDVDWAEVRKALKEIGFSGSATVELEAGDEAYLRDVSNRVDRLLLGKA